MKKALALLLSIGMSAALLTGCGGGGKTGSSPSGTAAQETQKTEQDHDDGTGGKNRIRKQKQHGQDTESQAFMCIQGCISAESVEKGKQQIDRKMIDTDQYTLQDENNRVSVFSVGKILKHGRDHVCNTDQGKT